MSDLANPGLGAQAVRKKDANPGSAVVDDRSSRITFCLNRKGSIAALTIQTYLSIEERYIHSKRAARVSSQTL